MGMYCNKVGCWRWERSKSGRGKRYDEYGVSEAFQLNPDKINLLGFTLFDNGTWADEIGLRNAVHFEVRQASYNGIF